MEPTSKKSGSKEPPSKEPTSQEPTSKEPPSGEPTSKELTSKGPPSKEPGSKKPTPKAVTKEQIYKEPPSMEQTSKEPTSKELKGSLENSLSERSETRILNYQKVLICQSRGPKAKHLDNRLLFSRASGKRRNSLSYAHAPLLQDFAYSYRVWITLIKLPYAPL